MSVNIPRDVDSLSLSLIFRGENQDLQNEELKHGDNKHK